MPAAATSSRQQAAARTAVICCSAGFSWRHLSTASGHLVLNGQPDAAGPLLAARARTTPLKEAGVPFGVPLVVLFGVPVRRALPRLSGSGAEATSSWV